MNQKKTAYLGLFAAIAIIFGYVESLIPFFAGIPGMKLGLANLAVLFVLERYTWKEAALVSIVRIFIIGFMFGSGSSIMYSLAGATLSLIVMVFVKNKIGFGQLGAGHAGCGPQVFLHQGGGFRNRDSGGCPGSHFRPLFPGG